MRGGEADPRNYIVRAGDGALVSPEEAICLIIKQDPATRTISIVGTGFFITNYGLMITAKHVLMEALDSAGQPNSAIGIVHVFRDTQYLLRHFVRCWHVENSDVAVAMVAQATHNKSGDPLKNKILCLDEREQQKGAVAFTYVYPASNVSCNPPQQILHLSPNYYEGTLEEHYPNGRDQSLLPNPCWRTSIALHGGASSGPVFNSEGLVIGVNSSSFSGGESLSFVSSIPHILNLSITDIVILPETSPRNYTLRQLQNIGHIRVHG